MLITTNAIILWKEQFDRHINNGTSSVCIVSNLRDHLILLDIATSLRKHEIGTQHKLGEYKPQNSTGNWDDKTERGRTGRGNKTITFTTGWDREQHSIQHHYIKPHSIRNCGIYIELETGLILG